MPNVKQLVKRPELGKILPDLLDDVCNQRPNPKAFNQLRHGRWQAWSTEDFRRESWAIAQGLVHLDLSQGERVAFLMRSDINFALADLACAQAGLVSVPITLTETLANIAFILNHAEAQVLFVSNLDLLYQVIPQLWDKPALKAIVVVDVPPDWQAIREQELYHCGEETEPQVCDSQRDCLCLPIFSAESETQRVCPPFPQCIQVFSWQELRELEPKTEASPEVIPRQPISPQDVATILYTPVDSGVLKGVMLTHENLSANALTAFRGAQIRWGHKQRALSFLPMTHVFARVLFYGHLYYGHSLYFTSPSRVMKQFKVVKPTIFATVPLLLEKTYSKLQQLSQPQGVSQGISAELSWRLLAWGIHLAQRYDPRQKPRGAYAAQLRIADWLVFRRWRSQFGGKLNCLLCGGAPLRPEVARVFAAAGFPLLQGYGLTQTSSVVSYSRGQHIRADTVGISADGAEIAVATDGEVLVRGPYVMKGYFNDEVATQAAIDADGWFHTGDRGQFDDDGFLTITGSKKSLFKLATGKYVAPEALEREVTRSPLVAHAIAVGRGRKFCGLLVFPAFESLEPHLQALGKAAPMSVLLQHPEVLQRYQRWIETVNQQFPKWSTVKRFQLVNASLSVDAGSLRVEPDTGEIRLSRDAIAQIYTAEIESLYSESHQLSATHSRHTVQAVMPPLPASTVQPAAS